MSASTAGSQPVDSAGDQEQDHPHRQRASRVFACVSCQRRKVKCDRNTPCYNCIKSKVTCVPSTVAPPRKRRKPRSDLLERVARCEALLRRYASSAAGSLQDESASGPEAPSATPADSPQDDLAGAEPRGKLVVEDGGVRFTDKYLQGIIQENLQVMKEIIDAGNVLEPSPPTAGGATPSGNEDLLLSRFSAVDIGDTLPSAPQIFRLWQIFLDRVNPLTKVIHAPTVQPFVLEAATNHEAIPDNHRALLFAIYLSATVALSRDESRSMLNMDKNTALDKFTKGIKSALVKADFMKNYDMVTVQALVLYLTTIYGRSARDEIWFLSGVVMRMARKLGMHRDGETLQLSAFDTEMRRRLWWQLVIFDAKSATASGIRETLLPSDWDTKMPANINDTDMSPQTTTIRAHDGPTEMVWCLMLCTLAQFMNENRLPNFDDDILRGQGPEPGSPGYEAYLKSVERYSGILDALDARLLAAERKYCNPAAGPIHVHATCLRPRFIARMRALLMPMRECPEWGIEVNNARDNLFRISLCHHEANLSWGGGFEWSFRSHFRVDSFLYMVGEMYMRPQTGSFADRFWRVAEGVYRHHEDLWDMSSRENVRLGRFVVQTWRVRERALLAMGIPYDVPVFVQRLMVSLPQQSLGEAGHHQSADQQVGPSLLDPSSSTEQLLDQSSGGFLDTTLAPTADDSINDFSMDKWEGDIPAFPFNVFGSFGGPHDSGTGW